jgi:hypothetical protein
MMNIWADPAGASEQFFDGVVNTKIRDNCKPPIFEGNIKFEFVVKNGKERIVKPEIYESRLRSLKWFVPLSKQKDGSLRPNQLHNYIIGADIGFGLGASNSTAEIVDVNTGENVGEFITSDKTPEEFADCIVALAQWIGGGTGEAYVIFENNGGQGGLFSKRIISRGLTLVYTKTTEQKKTRKRLNEYGWFSSPKEKEFVLGLLQGALKEGLKEQPIQKYVKIYNETIVDELDDYIFYESGEISSNEGLDETTSARKRHGDRVVGLALCILALQDQGKMQKIADEKVPWGSYEWRSRQRKLNEVGEKKDWSEPKQAGWK